MGTIERLWAWKFKKINLPHNHFYLQSRTDTVTSIVHTKNKIRLIEQYTME